jgi:hypothetical protein
MLLTRRSAVNAIQYGNFCLWRPAGLVNCAGVAPAEKVVGKEGPHRLESFAKDDQYQSGWHLQHDSSGCRSDA